MSYKASYQESLFTYSQCLYLSLVIDTKRAVFSSSPDQHHEKGTTTSSLGQKTLTFSSGTCSNADYTTPSMKNYIGSEEILNSIYEYEEKQGLIGFHLLIHPGTSLQRTDTLWKHLNAIITRMKQLGYGFERF